MLGIRVEVLIQNESQEVFMPVVIGNATWNLKRAGSPGKLTFTALTDDILKISEGNAVRLDIDGKPVFFGYIFERSWSKEGQISVTAYDQLRYLKNKDSYSYDDLTAGEVIQMIAADFRLQTGELADTGHKIKNRIEKDKTLFDIILSALDLTMVKTKQMYILYDDVGKLTLKNIADMKLTLLIDKETAQDYNFKSSIDGETYNQIKLYYDNQDSKKREIYFVTHTENINKWGVLQYNESIDEGVNGQAVADMYLDLYNRPTRSLSIKNAFGDVNVRAGCLLPVILDIKDMDLKNYLLVEEVTHRFDEGNHTMDLTLRGAGISG